MPFAGSVRCAPPEFAAIASQRSCRLPKCVPSALLEYGAFEQWSIVARISDRKCLSAHLCDAVAADLQREPLVCRGGRESGSGACLRSESSRGRQGALVPPSLPPAPNPDVRTVPESELPPPPDYSALPAPAAPATSSQSESQSVIVPHCHCSTGASENQNQQQQLQVHLLLLVPPPYVWAM